MQEELSALPAVAREAIRAVLEGRAPVPPVAADGALARAAPVFVTLRVDGELRGCMGTLVAQHEDLVRETMERAVVAAFEDPRFPPLSGAELPRCAIEVTILGPLEDVTDPSQLDARRFGVEVSDSHGRRGVLLPGIEGIDDPPAQIAIARRKAGIPPGVPILIRRFQAVKVSE